MITMTKKKDMLGCVGIAPTNATQPIYGGTKATQYVIPFKYNLIGYITLSSTYRNQDLYRSM